MWKNLQNIDFLNIEKINKLLSIEKAVTCNLTQYSIKKCEIYIFSRILSLKTWYVRKCIIEKLYSFRFLN